MDEQNDQEKSKRPRGVYTIAFWLLCSTAVVIFNSIEPLLEGQRFDISLKIIVQWVYCAYALVCWLGLLFFKEWARRASIYLLWFHFGLALWVANQLSGASFPYLLESLSTHLALAVNYVKMVFIGVLVCYILWPVIAWLYLAYPSVKFQFVSFVNVPGVPTHGKK